MTTVTCGGCGQYQSGHASGRCWKCRNHTELEKILAEARAKDEAFRRAARRRELDRVQQGLDAARALVRPEDVRWVPQQHRGLLQSEIRGAIARLATTRPDVVALASTVRLDDMARLCRAEFIDRDVNGEGWEMAPVWFGVVIVSTPQRGRLQGTGHVVAWHQVAAQLRRQVSRGGLV